MISRLGLTCGHERLLRPECGPRQNLAQGRLHLFLN